MEVGMVQPSPPPPPRPGHSSPSPQPSPLQQQQQQQQPQKQQQQEHVQEALPASLDKESPILVTEMVTEITATTAVLESAASLSVSGTLDTVASSAGTEPVAVALDTTDTTIRENSIPQSTFPDVPPSPSPRSFLPPSSPQCQQTKPTFSQQQQRQQQQHQHQQHIQQHHQLHHPYQMQQKFRQDYHRQQQLQLQQRRQQQHQAQFLQQQQQQRMHYQQGYASPQMPPYGPMFVQNPPSHHQQQIPHSTTYSMLKSAHIQQARQKSPTTTPMAHPSPERTGTTSQHYIHQPAVAESNVIIDRAQKEQEMLTSSPAHTQNVISQQQVRQASPAQVAQMQQTSPSLHNSPLQSQTPAVHQTMPMSQYRQHSMQLPMQHTQNSMQQLVTEPLQDSRRKSVQISIPLTPHEQKPVQQATLPEALEPSAESSPPLSIQQPLQHSSSTSEDMMEDFPSHQQQPQQQRVMMQRAQLNPSQHPQMIQRPSPSGHSGAYYQTQKHAMPPHVWPTHIPPIPPLHYQPPAPYPSRAFSNWQGNYDLIPPIVFPVPARQSTTYGHGPGGRMQYVPSRNAFVPYMNPNMAGANRRYATRLPDNAISDAQAPLGGRLAAEKSCIPAQSKIKTKQVSVTRSLSSRTSSPSSSPMDVEESLGHSQALVAVPNENPSVNPPPEIKATSDIITTWQSTEPKTKSQIDRSCTESGASGSSEGAVTPDTYHMHLQDQKAVVSLGHSFNFMLTAKNDAAIRLYAIPRGRIVKDAKNKSFRLVYTPKEKKLKFTAASYSILKHNNAEEMCCAKQESQLLELGLGKRYIVTYDQRYIIVSPAKGRYVITDYTEAMLKLFQENSFYIKGNDLVYNESVGPLHKIVANVPRSRTAGEVVKHLDGNKMNNTKNNLVVFYDEEDMERDDQARMDPMSKLNRRLNAQVTTILNDNLSLQVGNCRPVLTSATTSFASNSSSAFSSNADNSTQTTSVDPCTASTEKPTAYFSSASITGFNPNRSKKSQILPEASAKQMSRMVFDKIISQCEPIFRFSGRILRAAKPVKISAPPASSSNCVRTPLSGTSAATSGADGVTTSSSHLMTSSHAQSNSHPPDGRTTHDPFAGLATLASVASAAASEDSLSSGNPTAPPHSSTFSSSTTSATTSNDEYVTVTICTQFGTYESYVSFEKLAREQAEHPEECDEMGSDPGGDE